jgi:hypothetical protein
MRRFARSVLFLALLTLMLATAQFVMTPRYDRDLVWAQYESLPPESVEVLFLGASPVHSNINPVIIWEETGIRSYDLSGSAQPLLFTYWHLEEALTTQSPDLVVLELHMLSHQNREFTEIQKNGSLTMMPLGKAKLRLVAEALPSAEWTRYLIPLEKFHSRWSELRRSDFDPAKWSRTRDNLYLGFRSTDRVEAQAVSSSRRPYDEALYEENYSYVSRIIERAHSAGAEVLLLVSPSARPHLHDEWMERFGADVAEDYPSVRILDAEDFTGDFGLDYATDFYDGTHLNTRGAEKHSRWLARQIEPMLGLRSTVPGEISLPWQNALQRYVSAER